MAAPNFLRVLNGQHLQQAGRDDGEINKGLDGVHCVGQQPLGFLRHILYLIEGEGLIFGNLPSFRPEMITNPANDVTSILKRRP